MAKTARRQLGAGQSGAGQTWMYTIEPELNIDTSKQVLAMFLNEELFWMNNKAINEFCFRKIWRIKQISRPSASVDNTIPDLLNSSHPTQPHSLIAKY